MAAGPITLQAEYHKTTLGVPKPDARGRGSRPALDLQQCDGEFA
jgi:hypothetical protein